MEAVVFIGLQASGKSSFYKERFFSTHVRISKAGLNEQQATKRLFGLSVGQKNELLFQYGINFNDIPNWQKRGVGLYWEEYDKPSVNPITNEEVTARRRRIRTDFDLPMKDMYGQFVRSLISQPQTQGA